ncbi:histidine kinase dimerization/phosphoacceptor domain -containing protein [Candidatus Magnetomonas plexicatena]|uniref:histidine kinase dimerization/phosphoacceptor domain -containing protein n=1 Tax=Candidatus Magnetomonas plexicatena TaxID=2552947 RepID=UPI001C785A24|nr:response regulator [Nitrospirales bacterium LBB_01]
MTDKTAKKRTKHDLTVLYVEDDDVTRVSLVNFLERNVTVLHVAHNGMEGLSLFETSKPDLIITDIRMPVMDGLAMSKAIKEKNKSTPIIVTTSHNDVHLLLSAIDIGIDKYIVKPIKFEQLGAAINSCANSLYQERQIRQLNEDLRQNNKRLSEKTLYLDSILRSSSDVGIVAMDLDFCIRYFSPAAEKLLGVKIERAMGFPIPELFQKSGLKPSFLDEAAALITEDSDYTFPFTTKVEDISYLLECRLSGIWERKSELAGFVLTVHDITERHNREELIKASLREKEVLLREVHHRVKNNMQIISSLMRLQARYIDDEKLVAIFKDSENRIKSMALVHEKLYKTNDMARIDFAAYVKSLTYGLYSSYSIHGSVSLNVDIGDVTLGIDTAIPCGLIINELISNSLKYAFTSGERGEVSVSLRETEDGFFELIVKDTGAGIPESIDFRNSESLGLQLVVSLSEDQLHGKISLNRDNGTAFTIKFKEFTNNHFEQTPPAQ